MTTPAQLSAQIVDLLTRWNAQRDQMADWLTGDPAGGPNGDGKYPLTNAAGETQNFLSLPAVLSLVSGPAAAASDAQAAAELAAALAQAAKVAAEAALAQANTARDATAASKNTVDSQRDDVAAKWSDVGFWYGKVNASQLAIATAEVATLQYRDETLQARDDTIVAKDAAQIARDQASAFAASINPSLLATKAELDGKLSISAFTWEGLSGKPATFTPSAHNHTISEVTGLQTALDGKQAVGSYANAAHTHSIVDVNGLQAALDAKLATTSFTWAGLSGKPATFAPSTHTHSIAQVTDLQGTLDDKLATASFTWGNLPGKPSTFAPSAHTHAISEVTGLQGALDARLLNSGGSISGNLTVGPVSGSLRLTVGTAGQGTDGAIIASETGHSLRLHPNSGPGAYNSLVQAGDTTLIFTGGPVGSGAMTVAPWSDAPYGMRMTAGGLLSLHQNVVEQVASAPTFWLRDTDHRAFAIHVNYDVAYFMRGGTNDPNWQLLDTGNWPMQINLNSGDVTVGRNLWVTSNIFTPAVRFGDDAVLEDVNIGNTVCVRGQQNSDRGYIQFGLPGASSLLGAIAGGALTFNGNTVWHTGNFDPSTRAPLVHGHSINDVSGLQAALDSKGPAPTGGSDSTQTYFDMPVTGLGTIRVIMGTTYVGDNGTVTVNLSWPFSTPLVGGYLGASSVSVGQTDNCYGWLISGSQLRLVNGTNAMSYQWIAIGIV